MTRHPIFAFRGAASLLPAIVLFALGCGGHRDAGCDGATRGCVLLSNILATDVTINVIGYGSTVVPAGTESTPGTTWYTVDSTVGAQVTFSASQFNPGIDTCVVTASTWADPSKPAQVNVYYSGGTAVRCYNW
jgi:hypothetical protein